jgi:hypothetical protein
MGGYLFFPALAGLTRSYGRISPIAVPKWLDLSRYWCSAVSQFCLSTFYPPFS